MYAFRTYALGPTEPVLHAKEWPAETVAAWDMLMGLNVAGDADAYNVAWTIMVVRGLATDGARAEELEVMLQRGHVPPSLAERLRSCAT